MSKTFKGMALGLAGALAAAVLVAGVTPTAAKAASEPRFNNSIMIGASALQPQSDNLDYINAGNRLRTITGAGSFLAPVPLPVGDQNIRSFTAFIADHSETGRICVALYRQDPKTGGEVLLDSVCTPTSATSVDDPTWMTSSRFLPRMMQDRHQLYVWVTIDDPSVYFYGVKIVYN